MVAKKQSHEKNFGFWQNIKTVVVSHKKKNKRSDNCQESESES